MPAYLPPRPEILPTNGFMNTSQRDPHKGMGTMLKHICGTAPSAAKRRPNWRFGLVRAAVAVSLLCVCAPAFARPSSMRLFPQDTLVFVRITNARQLADKFKETSTGRMLRDPQLQPFIERLYGETGQLYADQAEQLIGISWEELQQLPQGEVAFAVVARATDQPAFLLLVDQGDAPSAARRLMERALEFAIEKGAEISKETISGEEVTIIRDKGDEDRLFGMFERENTIVVANDADVLRGVLWHWDGGGAAADSEPAAAVAGESPEGEATQAFVPGETLAENLNFSSILRNCRRPQDPPPQLILFADPIGLIQEISKEEGGAQMFLGSLRLYGGDGLLGLGGTVTLATGPYDDLTHAHILLETPRAGVMQLFAFEPGDTTPQNFIPSTVENYMTANWNFGACYDRIKTMVDQIFGDGWFEDRVRESVSAPLGIDLKADVIDNLSGRVTMTTAYAKPATLTSQQSILAVELEDEGAARRAMDAVLDQLEISVEERRFGNVTYYAMMVGELEELPEDERPLEPFVAIMDGYLFLGGSCKNFEQMIAARDGTIERLSESEDYARIAATLGRETAGIQPAGFLVNRWEEQLRHWYELLTSEQGREFFGEQAADNRFFAALVAALDENELPPFDVLSQYTGPNGGILYDTDTGFHAISFTLREEAGQ